jgi:BirA family biotin operon repressor/biotin-[acetyl-CoA-carboxylase] ligase
MEIIEIEHTPSTNLYLKIRSKEQILPEATIIVTGNQTDGRGQRGNTWEAEPGKNITCSMLLYPDFLPLKQNFLLSEVIALGIKETLDEYSPSVTIKWPNDIYCNGKKICGILIENELMENRFSKSIVGIGLNVNQEIFSSKAPNPISLKQIRGKETELKPLLEKMACNILLRYEQLRADKTETIIQAYHNSLYRRSGFHTYQDANGTFQARTERVADDGTLFLITRSGEKRHYMFKEVVFQ